MPAANCKQLLLVELKICQLPEISEMHYPQAKLNNLTNDFKIKIYRSQCVLNAWLSSIWEYAKKLMRYLTAKKHYLLSLGKRLGSQLFSSDNTPSRAKIRDDSEPIFRPAAR